MSCGSFSEDRHVIGQRYFNSNMTVGGTWCFVLFALCGTVPSCSVLCSLVNACNALQFKPLQSRYVTIGLLDIFDSKQESLDISPIHLPFCLKSLKSCIAAWHRPMEKRFLSGTSSHPGICKSYKLTHGSSKKSLCKSQSFNRPLLALADQEAVRGSTASCKAKQQ